MKNFQVSKALVVAAEKIPLNVPNHRWASGKAGTRIRNRNGNGNRKRNRNRKRQRNRDSNVKGNRYKNRDIIYLILF